MNRVTAQYRVCKHTKLAQALGPDLSSATFLAMIKTSEQHDSVLQLFLTIDCIIYITLLHMGFFLNTPLSFYMKLNE